MALPFVTKLYESLLNNHPMLLYAATWTAFISATVAVVSLCPEVAFTSAVSPSSSFSAACGPAFVRLPLDGPAGEVICVPALLFGRSGFDMFVPPLFALLVVSASICFVKVFGLWEVDDQGFS